MLGKFFIGIFAASCLLTYGLYLVNESEKRREHGTELKKGEATPVDPEVALEAAVSVLVDEVNADLKKGKIHFMPAAGPGRRVVEQFRAHGWIVRQHEFREEEPRWIDLEFIWPTRLEDQVCR